MVILATKTTRLEAIRLRKANCTFDVNGESKFSGKDCPVPIGQKK